MSKQPMVSPAPEAPAAHQQGQRRPAGPARAAHGDAPARCDEPSTCPACGAELRLWANYHRCGNCGYKESCCF